MMDATKTTSMNRFDSAGLTHGSFVSSVCHLHLSKMVWKTRIKSEQFGCFFIILLILVFSFCISISFFIRQLMDLIYQWLFHHIY